MANSPIRLGVFSVSMPEYEPAEAMELLAELGYQGVEWRVNTDTGDRAKPSFWSGNRTTQTAAEIVANADDLIQRAEELGLEMPTLGTYIDCYDFDVVEQHMHAAASIGARSLRIGPGGYDRTKATFHQHMASARAAYAQVADLAAKYDVRAVIETHMGLLTPTVATARMVLEGLDPRHVGIMWDPGNQVVEGNERYDMALDIAGDYLAEVHVKNLRHVPQPQPDGSIIYKSEACPVHQGEVNWAAVVTELNRIGYNGWVMFEDFSTTIPTRDRLAANIAYFRKLLEA